jgi:hypothetical protein
MQKKLNPLDTIATLLALSVALSIAICWLIPILAVQ